MCAAVRPNCKGQCMEDTKRNLMLLLFCIAINWKNLETDFVRIDLHKTKVNQYAASLSKLPYSHQTALDWSQQSLNLSQLFSIPLQIHCKFCSVFVVVVAVSGANRTFDTAVCR